LKKKIGKILSVGLPLILGALLIIYNYNSYTPEEIAVIKSHFINANYEYVIFSGFLAILGYVFRAYRWKYTLNYVGYQSSFKTNFLAVSIAYFLNLTIPRSGEVSRALILKKYQDVPFDKGFGTIISERIIDLFILILFILTAVIIEFSTLKMFLIENIPVYKLIGILAFGLIGFIIFVYLYTQSKWSLILKLKTKIAGLVEGALSVFKMPNKWPFMFYTLLIWLTYITMFYCVIFALEDTKNISFGAVVVAFVIGSLTITFTNGGFGFFPTLIQKILLLYAVPKEAGEAFGWIVWSSQFIITVVIGGLAFVLLPLLHKNK